MRHRYTWLWSLSGTRPRTVNTTTSSLTAWTAKDQQYSIRATIQPTKPSTAIWGLAAMTALEVGFPTDSSESWFNCAVNLHSKLVWKSGHFCTDGLPPDSPNLIGQQFGYLTGTYFQLTSRIAYASSGEQRRFLRIGLRLFGCGVWKIASWTRAIGRSIPLLLGWITILLVLYWRIGG